MDRTAAGGRAARLLAALAVLLGLLAMHGLASSHHSPAAAATPAGAPSAAHHGPGPAERHSAHDAPAPLVAAAAPLPGGAALDGACTGCPDHGAGVLCLAVLSAGLALLTLLLALRARTTALPAPRQRLPLRRTGPPLRLRPPDLVSQLCVSRT